MLPVCKEAVDTWKMSPWKSLGVWAESLRTEDSCIQDTLTPIYPPGNSSEEGNLCFFYVRTTISSELSEALSQGEL